MSATCTGSVACVQHLLWRVQMQKIPDLEKLNITDITSYGGAMEHGEERAKKHDKAASLYNHVRSEPLALWMAVYMLLFSSLLAGLYLLIWLAHVRAMTKAPWPCSMQASVRRACQAVT